MHYVPIDGVSMFEVVVLSAAIVCGALVGWHLHRFRRQRDAAPSIGPCFFEQIRDAALVTDNGVIIQANVAAADQFGYPRDLLVGMEAVRLLANPDDERRLVRTLRDGPVTDFEIPLRRADGQILDCQITAAANFDADGRHVISARVLARNITERNRIVAELQRVKQDYRGLFENAHDAILILDPLDETVLDVNPHACTLYDYPREEFIGRSMVELSVDPRRGQMMMQRTREGDGRFATFESRQTRRDGTVIDVEINAAEVLYGGRRVVLSINRDITARRTAEKAVRESEERFRLLLESVTDYAVVMLDPRGHVMSWNEGAQRIMGYTEAEILGRSAAIFLPPQDQDRLIESLCLAAASDRVVREMTRVRRDGSTFAASVALTKIVDETGSLRGYAEVTRDITERTELETARHDMMRVLREVASEWAETFDAVQAPIIVIGSAGEIRRLNRAAQMLAGGRPFSELIHMRIDDLPGEPWTTVGRAAREVIAHGTAGVQLAAKGDRVWQVSTCLGGTPGRERRAIVVAYDLTVVKRLEASLRHNEFTAALGTLVAGVAHEVRNPLFTISATLEAWEARYGATDGIVRYGGALREQVDRLNRLMRDLLDYGKPSPLSIAHTSLAPVIEAAVVDCLPAAKQQEISFDVAIDEMQAMPIDEARLEQVFQNVIDNAIHHSPAGGVVRIEARLDGNVVVCRILDEGPGFSTDDPEKLFSPFFTRRRGGTGLGLSIARKFVSAHGGEIELANREDRNGAMVVIRIPTQSPAAPMAADAEAAPELLHERAQ